VKDRLPELGEKVLVCFGHIYNILIGYLAKYKDNQDVWVVYFKDGEVINQGEYAEVVTHWQQLPQPPKQ
jgi:predicted alpha/beta superfamily hydrolase